MWQIYAMTAMDLANERMATAREQARIDRSLAHGPSWPRRTLARVFHGLSDAAVALSNASASAARSLEGEAG